MYEWSLVVEGDAVLEICDSNRVRPEKRITITRKLHLQANVTKKSSSCTIHLIDYKHLERADLPG